MLYLVIVSSIKSYTKIGKTIDFRQKTIEIMNFKFLIEKEKKIHFITIKN